jgi:hypothetical protein
MSELNASPPPEHLSAHLRQMTPPLPIELLVSSCLPSAEPLAELSATTSRCSRGNPPRGIRPSCAVAVAVDLSPEHRLKESGEEETV